MIRFQSYFKWFSPLLTIVVILGFYGWVAEQRFFYLIGFIVSGILLTILFIKRWSHASRPDRRLATAVVLALTATFFLAGFLMYRSNKAVIVEADRVSLRERSLRYRNLADGFFLEHLKRAEALKNRLTSAPMWNQAKLLSGFFENRPEDYVSVLILDTSGVSVASAPAPISYKESSSFRSFDRPTFGDPEFSVRFGAGVETPLSTIKLFVPYRSGDGFEYWLLLNVRFEPLQRLLKEQIPNVSVYLTNHDDILISNERFPDDRNFRQIHETGFHEDPEKNQLITRANLTGIPWQIFTVQPLDEAFPNARLAEDGLLRVMIFGTLTGLSLGMALSLHLILGVFTTREVPLSQKGLKEEASS